MPTNKTLGISTGHDSGVALIEGSQIVFAANEERFSRIKGHSGIPEKSLDYLLKNGYLDNLDRIALDGKVVVPHGKESKYRFEQPSDGLQGFAEKLRLESVFLKSKLGISLLRTIYLPIHSKMRNKQNNYFKELLDCRMTPVYRVDHHMAHGASIAFPGDPNVNGLVITLDGIGEGICSRVLGLESGKLVTLDYTPALGSPALMYGYATQILGYRINRHEGKLTGLAAYGNYHKTSDIFQKHFTVKGRKLQSRDIGYGLKAIEKLSRELEGFSPEDIAAGVQHVFEKNITDWIREIVKKYRAQTVFLSGGAFANVKLNQRIAQLDEIEDLVICPNMGDGGLALGAAALVHNQKIELSSLYLGTSIQSHNLVDEGYKIVYKGEGFHSLIAKLLFEGEVVAVARGPMEYGPRALGNRSILYAAREKEVNKWLNKRLKRTEFMPFAPVCRDIDAVKNFNLDLSIERYRHMTITCDVTEYCKQTAAAIVHIDGTARPQILFKQDNPDLYEILTQYAKFVDNAILVNTSFNMHEEPIVRTSEEAIHAFKTSGIDYMLLGNEVLKNLDK